ncbi:ABC transporter ATP-binding protein [Actinotalea sp. K2]|uniref:ABC transporter ATP-binding protein n=1 Tax=Actinotalea sp. K2 TaxID=2939438 RepID=UPI002016ACDB|nr:ATP-binding cassette domain-containing protein [Actinotalea sp. K2]MCL3861782.1 ATP-binding cassette domain-containing protein [Actinotalea sp. K2]
MTAHARHVVPPAHPAPPVLEVRGATLTYRSGAVAVIALHPLDLTVAPGEMVCVAGPSGSGKSTLCHLAAGFERPTHGQVLVNGQAAHEVCDWSTVASVPQQLGLLPELTVGQNIALPAARAGQTWDGRPDLLAEWGLTGLADRLVGEVSMGEQQRTALARAVVLTPALVVLDEPTGHQDDDNVERVLRAVIAATRRGSGVLVSAHDDRVLAAADRVVRLEDGVVRRPAH